MRGEDVAVFEIRARDSRCDACGKELSSGSSIRVVAGAGGAKLAHCLACAGLDHLVFLPTGDAGLTRRAKALSATHAVVVRWARARKRYERQGWLVEKKALEKAIAQLREEGAEPKWALAGDLWVRADRARRGGRR